MGLINHHILESNMNFDTTDLWLDIEQIIALEIHRLDQKRSSLPVGKAIFSGSFMNNRSCIID